MDQPTGDPTAAIAKALQEFLGRTRAGGWLVGHRKTIAFVFSMAVLLLNKKLGLNLDDRVLEWCAGLAMTYLAANVGEHFANAAKLKVMSPLLAASVNSRMFQQINTMRSSIPVNPGEPTMPDVKPL